jgi:hypothetical protein
LWFILVKNFFLLLKMNHLQLGVFVIHSKEVTSVAAQTGRRGSALVPSSAANVRTENDVEQARAFHPAGHVHHVRAAGRVPFCEVFKCLFDFLAFLG